MKKKGFTLIELLVVIAIIAMLLAILMPALNKVKRLAQRLVCGTNVKGLGTAMMVYAQDFEDRYPVQGGRATVDWSSTGRTFKWNKPDRSWSQASTFCTVSSSLYLLVRIADVDPKSFVCRSGEQTPFKGLEPNPDNTDLVELWDFGGEALSWGGTDDWPRKHVSYAYQLPYPTPASPARPASSTSSASTAILADKNPWQDQKLTCAFNYGSQDDKKKDYIMLVDWLGAPPPRIQWDVVDDPLRNSSTAWQIQIANSQPHGREGQNVLFGDGHTNFERRSDIGYQNDNIYTMWVPRTGSPPNYTENDKRAGINQPMGDPDPMPASDGGDSSYSVTDEDALLVNDDCMAAHNGKHGFKN